jgi:uncharacterized protein YkwD
MVSLFRDMRLLRLRAVFALLSVRFPTASRSHTAGAAAARRRSVAALAALIAAAAPGVALASTPRQHRHRTTHRHRTVRRRQSTRHRATGAGSQPRTARHAAAHASGRSSKSGACAGADVPVRSASAAQTRTAMLCLVNRERALHGLEPLRELPRLDRAAQGWANSMASSGRLSHTGKNSDPGSRVRSDGYAWSVVGEDIAIGYRTPRQVVAAWMASAPHCENILDPRFRDIGGGVPPASSSRDTWTLDFGLSRNARAASSNWRPANGCPYGR